MNAMLHSSSIAEPPLGVRRRSAPRRRQHHYSEEMPTGRPVDTTALLPNLRSPLSINPATDDDSAGAALPVRRCIGQHQYKYSPAFTANHLRLDEPRRSAQTWSDLDSAVHVTGLGDLIENAALQPSSSQAGVESLPSTATCFSLNCGGQGIAGPALLSVC